MRLSSVTKHHWSLSTQTVPRLNHWFRTMRGRARARFSSWVAVFGPARWHTESRPSPGADAGDVPLIRQYGGCGSTAEISVLDRGPSTAAVTMIYSQHHPIAVRRNAGRPPGPDDARRGTRPCHGGHDPWAQGRSCDPAWAPGPGSPLMLAGQGAGFSPPALGTSGRPRDVACRDWAWAAETATAGAGPACLPAAHSASCALCMIVVCSPRRHQTGHFT